MTLSVDRFDDDQVRAFLSARLRSGGAFNALRTALLSDHIRTLIWASHLHFADPHPVHTSRIFAALDRNVGLLFGGTSNFNDAARDRHSEYERTRDQLETCGDIVHVGNGYWIAGPVRVVRATASQAAFVTGGAPTSIILHALNTECRSIGVVRYVRGGATVRSPYPEETTADWLGTTEELATWTDKTLLWASTRLRPQAGIEDDSLQIYAPDVHRSHHRPGYWTDAKEFREPAPTLRLFRPQTLMKWTFDRPDYLGIFNNDGSGARLARSVQVSREIALRLQLGLDQKLETPRTIYLKRGENCFCLDLRFAFPHPESRVLSLGWRDEGDTSKIFFDELALPALNDVATALGVRVIQS